MENNSLQKIINSTGRKITECCCELCRAQCKIPCLGTPDDILNVIDAGYIDKLRLTFWATSMVFNKTQYPIVMVQAGTTPNGCVFFNNGLCDLHDIGLKPTEGKLSNHTIRLDNFLFERSLPWIIAKEWLDERNLPKILKIITLMEYYKVK